QRAADMVVDRPQGGNAGAARQAQGSAVDPVPRLGDAGQRAGTQPGEQGGPVEWLPVGKAQCERTINRIAATPPAFAQLRRRQGKYLADRVVELPDALEAGRERDLGERQIGGLDE